MCVQTYKYVYNIHAYFFLISRLHYFLVLSPFFLQCIQVLSPFFLQCIHTAVLIICKEVKFLHSPFKVSFFSLTFIICLRMSSSLLLSFLFLIHHSDFIQLYVYFLKEAFFDCVSPCPPIAPKLACFLLIYWHSTLSIIRTLTL